MHSFGLFLVVVSLLSLVYALLQKRKATKIAGAAFHPTGELTGKGTLTGLVSAEGSARPEAPFVAPCSGQPCMYYEVTVERVTEKLVKSESGYKTEKGTSRVKTDKAGTVFLLDDGSGPVRIDARESVSAPLKEAFGQTQSVSHGDIVLGQYRTHVPPHSGDERVLGIKVTEKIFNPQGKIFAMGRLAGGTLTKTDGLLGGLEIHAGGRDEILGKSAKHAKIGFIAGGAMFAPGLLFTLLFHAAPAGPDHSCQAGIANVTTETCTDRLYSDDGKSFDWKVTKPGTFTIDVKPPSDAKISINPEVTVKDTTGKTVVSGIPELSHPLPAGAYTINVHDMTKGRAATMTGGFGFTLKVTESAVTAPAVAAPAVAQAASSPASATTEPQAVANVRAAETHEHAPAAAKAAPAAEKPAHGGKKH